jgi:hypothetical protein
MDVETTRIQRQLLSTAPKLLASKNHYGIDETIGCTIVPKGHCTNGIYKIILSAQMPTVVQNELLLPTTVTNYLNYFFYGYESKS